MATFASRLAQLRREANLSQHQDVKRACKRAGVTEVSCHGLRHSFASLCYFLKDIPDRQIMLWGGWASSATLHKIYIRLTEKGQTDAKDSFTAFFEQKEKGQS